MFGQEEFCLEPGVLISFFYIVPKRVVKHCLAFLFTSRKYLHGAKKKHPAHVPYCQIRVDPPSDQKHLDDKVLTCRQSESLQRVSAIL